jgi:hypothetical protein
VESYFVWELNQRIRLTTSTARPLLSARGSFTSSSRSLPTADSSGNVCCCTSRHIEIIIEIIFLYAVYNENTSTLTPCTGCDLQHSALISTSKNDIVGIATRYGLNDRRVGVRVTEGSRIFSSPRGPDRLCGPPNFLYNEYRGLFPRG